MTDRTLGRPLGPTLSAASRRRWIAALAPLGVVVAACAQFGPALAGRVYRFEDIAGYFEPLWSACARAMSEGRFPTWDGGAWSGQPLVGDPQAGTFYPPNWIWLALPVLRAYAVAAAVHSTIAGLGMYALARARGRSYCSAAMAGIALGIGGFVVLQTRHIMFVEATAWLPWVAFFAWRFLDRGRRFRADLAGVALTVGLMLLTGGVSMIYYGAWFLGALLLPRALASCDAKLSTAGARHAIGPRALRLGALCIAAILGVLVAAPSLLPAASHGLVSPRSLGTEYDFASSVAWGGLHYLPSLFIPNLLGQDVRGSYIGGGTQWEIAGYYAGMLPFGLAMFALFAGPRRRRAERLALGGVFVLAVLLAPGAHSPVHALAYRFLPLYGAMRCPPRALYVFTLGIPLLGADGLDLLADRLRARAEIMLQRNSLDGARVLRRSILALLVAAPALTAVDLLVTHRAENPTITLAEAHDRAFPDAEAFLRSHLDRARGDRYINDVHLPHDLHNSGLLWGLENASGYSSLPIWRYLHLLWIANHGRPYPHPRLHDDLAAQGIWRFESPVVDLLGVRWVLAPRGWDPHATGYVKRFEGAAPESIDAWENTEALPRAFLAARVVPASSEVEAAAIVAASHKREGVAAAATPIDLGREIVLEPSRQPSPGAPSVEKLAAAPATALEPVPSIARPSETVFEVKARAAGDRVLVLSEPAHPGWRATLDGKAAPVEIVDYALVGVRVPAGEHVVRLEMTSPETTRGLAISAVALLCIAAIGLSGWLLRRPGGGA